MLSAKLHQENTPHITVIKGMMLTLILSALFLAGCGQRSTDPQPPARVEREPFSARTETGGGAVVAWSGYADGYLPGGEEEIEITIQNQTDESWEGRFCLQLMAGRSSMIVSSLEQREFTLQPGTGFSDTITIQLPEALDDGAYGLTLAVRKPGNPLVDLVPIQVGNTEEERDPTTQQDMEAALAACPLVEGVHELVELARNDLAQEAGVNLEKVDVVDVEPTEFPDASLGVPEPDKTYAQVLTPGYIIRLKVKGETYLYHAAGDRAVLVENAETSPDQSSENASKGAITVEEVQVTEAQIFIKGRTSLPEGTCLLTELWAAGVPQPWWPDETCICIYEGTWQFAVALGENDAPESLDPDTQYMIRAYEEGGPNNVSTFPFDLAPPPTLDS